MVHHSSSYKFDFESVSEENEEDIKSKLVKITKKVVPIIEKYEEKFLQHKDELLKLKNCN